MTGTVNHDWRTCAACWHGTPGHRRPRRKPSWPPDDEATAPEGAAAETITTTAARRQEGSGGAQSKPGADTPRAHRCGAATQRGLPCRTPVSRAGIACSRHRIPTEWGDTRPLEWYRLIHTAEFVRDNYRLGLAGVWAHINRGDYPRARREVERVLRYLSRGELTGGA